MRIEFWIHKATNLEYAILIAFPHCNNFCTNASQLYVVRTLSVLSHTLRLPSYAQTSSSILCSQTPPICFSPFG